MQSTWVANRTWSAFFCHFVDEGLTEIQRSFREEVFSIFVQLAFKYRQNNIHCTPLSPHSAKHQQQARILAAPGTVTGLMTFRWKFGKNLL